MYPQVSVSFVDQNIHKWDEEEEEEGEEMGEEGEEEQEELATIKIGAEEKHEMCWHKHTMRWQSSLSTTVLSTEQ